jgi:hypothetical protein
MALMSALSLGLVVSLNARARVHVHLSAHDQAILEQLSDVLARVSKGNLGSFVRVDPNAALSDLEDGSSESLLKSQECHIY